MNKSNSLVHRPVSDPDLVFISTSDKGTQKAFVLDVGGRLRLDIVKQAFGLTRPLEIIIS